MTPFDPFGDFELTGYLRNSQGEKDLGIIKVLEHQLFRAQLPKALDFLATRRRIDYEDFLKVHEILFKDLYPWAGQDRAETLPDRAVVKGDVYFCHPGECRLAVQHGLTLAQEGKAMTNTPGRVMGMFAYGHPFLDGNGRTMLLVHAELCMRAGLSVSWEHTDKDSYLRALTNEIEDPHGNHLDSYLRPFLQAPISRDQWLVSISRMRGLEGSLRRPDQTPSLSDPPIAAQYQDFERRRGYDLGTDQ